MSFKAAVFDLDGTLLDSLNDIAFAMNTALGKMGFPPHPIQDYKLHVGDGMAVLARRVLPAGERSDEQVAACVAAMRTEYAKNWSATTRPYSGIQELLNALVERGIKLAILSNKPDDFTLQVTQKLLPHWAFDPVFGAHSGRAHKPDPAGAREIATRLNVDPSECLFIGDTNADMRAAVGAGMYPVGVTWGFRDAQELLDSGAKLVISEPRELLALLGEN